MKLSVEQQHILDTIKTGTNVYVDAVAGTGKTNVKTTQNYDVYDGPIRYDVFN